jgi:hypothetical protein
MNAPIGEIIHIYDIRPEDTPPSLRKAAAAMLATAYEVDSDPRFEAANEQLQHTAHTVSQPPTATYEDLVFANCDSGVTLVMSPDPEAATHEVLFYRGHKQIEDQLAETIVGIETNDLKGATNAIRHAAASFGNLHQRLGRNAFNAFRPYFIGLNGYPGASGLYSASIPTLDLLIHGGVNMQLEERRRIRTDILSGLYPSHQSGKLLGLLDRPSSQQNLPEDIAYSLTKRLNTFRRVHTSSVQKLIPDALTGSTVGTAGIANVAGYLTSKYVDTGEKHD